MSSASSGVKGGFANTGSMGGGMAGGMGGGLSGGDMGGISKAGFAKSSACTGGVAKSMACGGGMPDVSSISLSDGLGMAKSKAFGGGVPDAPSMSDGPGVAKSMTLGGGSVMDAPGLVKSPAMPGLSKTPGSPGISKSTPVTMFAPPEVGFASKSRSMVAPPAAMEPPGAIAKAKTQAMTFQAPPGVASSFGGTPGEREYVVENTHLQAPSEGMVYRASKNWNDRATQQVKWGETVRGHDEGDGWLKISSPTGLLYLPFKANGHLVVFPKEAPAAWVAVWALAWLAACVTAWAMD